MVYCSNCGNELRENALFCDKCGAEVNAGTDSRSDEDLYDRYQQEFKAAKKEIRKRKNRRALFDLIMALVFAVIAAVCYSLADRTFLTNVILGSSAVCSPVAVVACVRDLIFSTGKDNRILDQINQAYENAKMTK